MKRVEFVLQAYLLNGQIYPYHTKLTTDRAPTNIIGCSIKLEIKFYTLGDCSQIHVTLFLGIFDSSIVCHISVNSLLSRKSLMSICKHAVDDVYSTLCTLDRDP